EPGESAYGAALREVEEEAGIKNPTYLAYLGRQSYSFVDADSAPAKKTVDWFLFHTADRTATPAAAEGFVAARWVSSIDARQASSHAAFDAIIERALSVLAWRAYL
ncbi:MAG: NUDIX domain-containing protein, partial [Angustibacter sp.]